MKHLTQRQSEAKERDKEYSELTTTQKIIKLDIKLGGGKGAVKQRARLAEQLKIESEGRVPKVSKPDKKPIPVFVSKAEERKWEHHQKQKQKKNQK